MKHYLINSFPIPRLPESPESQQVQNRFVTLQDRLISLSGRLAAIDERFATWAAEVEVPVGSLTKAEERKDAIAEVDALVAHLYGLTGSELGKIYATFHRGWAYEEPLTATLEHYDRWAKQLGGGQA